MTPARETTEYCAYHNADLPKRENARYSIAMKRALLILAVAGVCVYAATPVGAEPAVDADRYRDGADEYSFQYRYDGAQRNCFIAPDPTTVRCAVTAPAGTRVTIKGERVRPTGIEVTERGWKYVVSIPKPDRVHSLPAGARLSVHGASCTVPRAGGIECRIENSGFRQSAGKFDTRGRRLG